MSKKIVGKDGKTYVEKKPIYKRVWFWIIIFLVLGIGSTMGENGSTNNSSSSTNSTTKKESKPSFDKIGDTVKAGKVEYILKSVTKTSERNEFADDKPKNVIKVVYHVKNNDKKNLPIGTDLNVYGPDNSKLKVYPIKNSTFDAVAAGKEADVTTGFGTNKMGQFELQFAPLISTEKPAKFRVTVK